MSGVHAVHVSLEDALDSFTAGANWLIAIEQATHDVYDPNSSLQTRIKGYEELANLEKSINKSLFNASIDPAMAQLKTLFDTFLQSRPLMVEDPTEDDGKVYVQLNYEGHPATLFDLITAINSQSSDKFSLDFHMENGGSYAPCNWNTNAMRVNLNDETAGFNSIMSFSLNNATAHSYWKSDPNGPDDIDVDYTYGGGCNGGWSAHATFDVTAVERYAATNVDEQGHTVDVTKTDAYNKLHDYLEGIEC